MTLRLGIIGLSEDNGHPYSWSAICNGYDAAAMAHCDFPVIPAYLAQQTWPEARLKGVEVTHVWTQDRKLSERIAHCSLIEHVVDQPEDMIGEIDGLLLARDDAENHLFFARPFLEHALPVYIDKPVALSRQTLQEIYELERFRGQVFSCSALRFAKELQPSARSIKAAGRLQLITASTPKDWERYAIHLVDPILSILGIDKTFSRIFRGRWPNGGCSVGFSVSGGPTVQLTALGRGAYGTISLQLHGDQDAISLPFHDSFQAFREALKAFCDHAVDANRESTLPFNRRAVEIVEMGVT